MTSALICFLLLPTAFGQTDPEPPEEPFSNDRPPGPPPAGEMPPEPTEEPQPETTNNLAVPYTAEVGEQPQAKPERPPIHEPGQLYFRWQLGFGWSYSSYAIAGLTNVTGWGPASAGELALGAFVAKNVSLHASVWSSQNWFPSIQANGSTFDAERVESIVGYGAGVTVYTKSNLLFSAEVGGASYGVYTVSGNVTSGVWDYGVASRFTFGKEWRVGNTMGLGVVGNVLYTAANTGGGWTHTVQPVVSFTMSIH